MVKEVDVDDEGLQEFHSKFFHYPLYLDDNLDVYKALGERKMGFFGLMKLFSKGIFGSMSSRLKKKQIEGNLKGEGLLQGGLIIFDKGGKAIYSYQEITGDELPMEAVYTVVSSTKSKDSCPEEK